ncbi:retropepsin-like aspartic protease family protein [Carboxylicivirga marina]|uniref:Retroviral-like aspartic protease family protein n=1 Tax=Carboxylicivirga marina TaxID=2800988 RepID=A0ABS1HQT2_9BACT|nr:retropepsin-like aspartic protease [Carboxylicivirga marina]MBK3519907.1 retroviral-like aspartic protease family protein [Carboxylicivirga marina]
MNKYLLVLVAILYSISVNSQTVIKMTNNNGVYTMPCKVNGLPLNFIFDTGASNVSISLTEAIFMLKNGYLKESQMGTKEYYRLANGEISEGTKVVLSKVEIGNLTLENIEASIVHELYAPLLLGQSVLSKFSNIMFDYQRETLTLNKLGGKSNRTPNNQKLYSKSLECVSSGFYIKPDNDIRITNISTHLSQEKSKKLKTITYSNETGYRLKYIELKVTILNNLMEEINNYNVFVPRPVNNLENEIYEITEDISIEDMQTCILSISDWDIY